MIVMKQDALTTYLSTILHGKYGAQLLIDEALAKEATYTT